MITLHVTQGGSCARRDFWNSVGAMVIEPQGLLFWNHAGSTQAITNLRLGQETWWERWLTTVEMREHTWETVSRWGINLNMKLFVTFQNNKASSNNYTLIKYQCKGVRYHLLNWCSDANRWILPSLACILSDLKPIILLTHLKIEKGCFTKFTLWMARLIWRHSVHGRGTGSWEDYSSLMSWNFMSRGHFLWPGRELQFTRWPQTQN